MQGPTNSQSIMTRNQKRFVPTLETLEDRCQPTVLNYGGSLLPNVEAQAVFLGSAWTTPIVRSRSQVPSIHRSPT